MASAGKLSGKTALVTGSTGGIGLGIAEVLAAEGCHLILNGLGEPDVIEEQCEALQRTHGVRVAYDPANMMDAEAVRGMVAKADRDSDRGLDILVNNAGIQHVAPIEDFPPERWDAVIAINLSAVFHATAAALPAMKSRGWGRVVNIASAHGLRASVNKSAYVAAKHGVVGLTKTTALEVAGQGVTCNAICPGWVLTDLVRAQIEARAVKSGRSFEQEAEDLLSEKMPACQFVTPEQLGQFCVFLCSEGGDLMTGGAYVMDGGWTAR
ncbi:3-hydroxybutyrate dehydrogenase [Kiloniella sp. b19]|uniref:3-hydroxybutyrate dehydrogenase n=1 Tax=Kiloniella sp. GXU_MW_B19 TaxID=3141326 RepID=UPI0031E14108